MSLLGQPLRFSNPSSFLFLLAQSNGTLTSNVLGPVHFSPLSAKPSPESKPRVPSHKLPFSVILRSRTAISHNSIRPSSGVTHYPRICLTQNVASSTPNSIEAPLSIIARTIKKLIHLSSALPQIAFFVFSTV